MFETKNDSLYIYLFVYFLGIVIEGMEFVFIIA